MNRARSLPPAGLLVAAIGLGVAGWYGWDWYQLGHWSEQELRASVELNLALDLARDPQQARTVEVQDALRQRIRQELLDEIERDAATPRTYTLAGLLMFGLGLLQVLARHWLLRRDGR